jgi:cytochrome c-type biogenesis protein CcmH/NrfG
MRRQVDALYSSSRDAFEAGNLRTAITGWEQVEAMAPNYQSVREYLVTAYKFVGVEYYGQNKLAEAVEVWKAAQRLNPNNAEISEYIRRTESEIRKLKELSYEP